MTASVSAKNTVYPLKSVSEISLTTAIFSGFDKTRDEAWRKTLAETDNIITDELPLSKKALRRAKVAVNALVDAKSAAHMGTLYKNLFTHFHQNRLRAFISCAIEDCVPGQWTCVWSNARVKSICFSLHNLLQPITSSSSRLLRSTPIAVVAAFLQCKNNHPMFLTSAWWEERENRVAFYEVAMDYVLNLQGKEKLSSNESSQLKHSVKMFRMVFFHLSAYESDLSKHSFDEVPEKLQHQMVRMATDDNETGPQELNPLYFTEQEVKQILKSMVILVADLHKELACSFSLQKHALEHSKGEPVGSFCYVGTENDAENEEITEKAETKLYTMDSFIYDCSKMILDLREVLLRRRKEPLMSEVETILYELGQLKDGSIYRMSFPRLLAVVEVFEGDGIDLYQFDKDALAREIADRLTMKGKFSRKRVRTVLSDRRHRKRTPHMLKQKKKPIDSEDDSSTSEDETSGDENEGHDDLERNQRAQAASKNLSGSPTARNADETVTASRREDNHTDSASDIEVAQDRNEMNEEQAAIEGVLRIQKTKTRGDSEEEVADRIASTGYISGGSTGKEPARRMTTRSSSRSRSAERSNSRSS